MAVGDLILAGGLLFTMQDGEEPFFATLAINGGRVREIIPGSVEPGDLDCPPCATVRDARGLYVTPGFVDIHAHDEYEGGGDVVELSLLRQGVTTMLSGNCGSGPLFADS
ncbi:MAG: amidohydrolase family protein, partial [Synergistaceae bacterium]|nr:amidohydrolase family protein [Synergistaceae bacterium]